MNEEFMRHIRSFTRFIYVVTEEEDRFLVDYQKSLKKLEPRTQIFNAAFGLQPLEQYIRSWSTKRVEESPEATIHQAMIKMYQDQPGDLENFYIITDPERWMREELFQRRVLNLGYQLRNDDRTVKVTIFLSNKLYLPEKLQRYVQVVRDPGLNAAEIDEESQRIASKCRVSLPKNSTELFRGMMAYEIDESITQSVTRTKKDPNGSHVDPSDIVQYRRNQLKRTDLVQVVDTSEFSVEHVGGLHRFKRWAKETTAAWTQEGQAFGLKPPRGVMLLGIYGCGKSLSVKSLARMWGLPLVQFELGKLMSSGVGESEGNLYRATRLIEGISPCVVWLDEAEKSLSGGQSSGRSDAGTTARVLGILSTWVQETKSKITLALTANSLAGIPPEIVNRMTERFFVGLPSETERIDILKIHLAKNGQNPEDYNLASLAETSARLVGREIEQGIEAAMTKSFHAKKPKLDEAILANVLEGKPRIVNTMADEINSILDWVGHDKERDEGVRARYASDHCGNMRALLGT